VAHLQAEYAPRVEAMAETNVSLARAERVQQMVDEFAVSTSEAHKLLSNLRANIITPSK